MISIFGSRFLKIYLLELLFSRAHILRTLFNIQVGEGSYVDCASENISLSRLLIRFLAFIHRFLLHF